MDVAEAAILKLCALLDLSRTFGNVLRSLHGKSSLLSEGMWRCGVYVQHGENDKHGLALIVCWSSRYGTWP